MIPVQRPHLGPEELEAVSRVFDERWLGMGAVTKEFEEALKPFVGARHVIAVNTGTSALHLALDVLGLKPGDEVVLPSLTFVACVQAVLATGATPVFCEVGLDTLTIDVADALDAMTERTRVVMPVHYGGEVCDMDALTAAAHARGVTVVDDAAHAFGSTYHGRPVGQLADLSCFSFDPIKNITCGEGGAVTTDDDDLAQKMIPKRILGIDNDTWARYRNQRRWAYQVVTPGFRYHLSNINAAIGLAQLKRFDQYRARKRAIVRRYDEAFRAMEGLALIDHNLEETFPFFYIVRVLSGRRDAMADHLKERGVGTGVHYIPNHLHPLFSDQTRSLPRTERLYKEILTLPLYYEMRDADVETVVDGVSAFFSD
jgi:perosamine synthetase